MIINGYSWLLMVINGYEWLLLILFYDLIITGL